MEILKQIQHFLKPKDKEPDRFLINKDTPFVPTYKESDYLDEKGLQREIENLARSTKEAQDQINSRQIIARSPKEADEWTRFQAPHKKVWEITRYLTSLEEEYQTIIDQSESGQRPLTMLQQSF